jgi:CRISPR-associated endonuclease/helicase Cas3
VYRSEAGLDSEIQAAGRCNREGRRPAEDSFVYVFSPEDKYQGHLPSVLKRPISITQIVERQYGEDITCPAAISEYFRLLYQFSGNELDVKNIVKRLEEGVIRGMNFPFKQISNDFRIIENDTYTVIVPKTETSKGLANRLRSGERTQDLFRKIQMYAVNLYKKDYEALCGVGALEQIDKGIIDSGLSVLTDLSKYHEDMGLQCPENGGVAVFA